MVERKTVTASRDTGSKMIVVDATLVPKEKITDRKWKGTLARKDLVEEMPIAIITMDTPYFYGETEVCVLENAHQPVLIGNYYGTGRVRRQVPVYPVREVGTFTGKQVSSELNSSTQTDHDSFTDMYSGSTITTDRHSDSDLVSGVQRDREPFTRIRTRKSSARTKSSKILLQSLCNKSINYNDLREAQRDDPSLEKVRQQARDKVEQGQVKFRYEEGILHRIFKDIRGHENKQIVVPRQKRTEVLSNGHGSGAAEHRRRKETQKRIWQDFFWPGFLGDIKKFCASCNVCRNNRGNFNFVYREKNKAPYDGRKYFEKMFIP